jgi:periplasmic protein TonB
MDREEKLGLGAAVGGHALLAIGLALGLFMAADRIVEPPSMSVTLVGDDAPEPAPAAAVMEKIDTSEAVEPAAEASAQEAESAQELAAAKEAIQERAAEEAKAKQQSAQAEANALATARAAEQAKANAAKASATLAEKARAKEAAARADAARRDAANAKLRQQQQAAAAAKAREAAGAKLRAAAEAKRAADAKRLADAKRKAGRDRELADAISKIGGTGQTKQPNAAATKTAKAKIGNQIAIKGCPDGIDADRIVTTVSINLNSNGTIASLSNVVQGGRTDSNAPQMEPTKRCVLDSIRAAAPFRGLDATEYESWKSIRIGFKAS